MVSEGWNMKTKLLLIVLSVISFNIKANEILVPKAPLEIEVYRSPSCGCCSKWIKHMKDNQFTVKDFVTNDVQSIKDKYAVTAEMSSCHTAIVNGYVVEGHVPASDIKQMLLTKPDVIGISVPGMPVGTPGMEMGERKDAYQVVSFDKNNKVQIVKSYEGN